MATLSIIEQPARVELKIDSDPANLATTRIAVEKLAERCGMEECSRNEIGLCVNEALANVIRHAYGGATDRPIHIWAQCAGDEMRIEIRDWGSGVNPASLPPKPVDPMRPGGLGLICLRQMMDSVNYQPQKDGMLLIMSRKRRAARAAC